MFQAHSSWNNSIIVKDSLWKSNRSHVNIRRLIHQNIDNAFHHIGGNFSQVSGSNNNNNDENLDVRYGCATHSSLYVNDPLLF